MNISKYDYTGIPDWFRLFLENDYAHLWEAVEKSCSRVDKMFWVQLAGLGSIIGGLLYLIVK